MRLVIDTSTLNVSVGIQSKDGAFIYHVDHQEPKHQQSKLILKMILKALELAGLKPADIEEVAVGVGPGSYTGIRVGLTIAKIWSFSMQTPLYCFSSRILLKRTLEKEPAIDFPKVKYLEKGDFQKVEDLQKLQPTYENDHFA